MKLSEIIIQYRSEKHLSQRQFADLCGLSNGYISMLEAEENPKTGEPISPTLNQLGKLAKGMNTTVEDLISSAEDLHGAQEDFENVARTAKPTTTGERIKAEREKRGFSQVDLADAVGTYRQQIFKYETGVIKDIPKETIEKIADALGVTPAYLCGWDEAKAETELDLQRRLRRAIGAKGFSYARLERLTGIPKSCIQRYATGTTKEIPAGKVKILADALDVDLLWMMGQPVNEEEKEEKKTVVNNDQTYTLYENVQGTRVQLGCKMTLIEVNATIENHAGVHGATQFIIDVEKKNKLGERLRELRTFRGLSQWQVSEILGTSKSSIAMYERGEREPGVQMLMSMAQFYRVSIDYLVGMTDKKEEN